VRAAISDCRKPIVVYVAPLTPSICADCAVSACWTSIGPAYELICADRWSPLGSVTVVTSVRRPLLTVIATWTGPHRVDTVGPV
jgi:hypothetical protein